MFEDVITSLVYVFSFVFSTIVWAAPKILLMMFRCLDTMLLDFPFIL